MRISYFTSKIFYYAGIIIFLLVVGFLLIPLLVELKMIVHSFADNLRAEIWGILVTVMFIMGVLDLREYFQWRPVKDMVLRKIGREVSSIFIYLTYLCEDAQVFELNKDESVIEFSKRTVTRQLEQLSVNVKLNKIAREKFLKGEKFPALNRRARNLADIETKYARFLDSSLRLSIMRIHENLDHLVRIISHSKQIPLYYANEDVFLELISTWINNIVKEIYKMHKEMEIEIW